MDASVEEDGEDAFARLEASDEDPIEEEDQEAGEVSIICSSCSFHGYVGDGEVLG